MSSVSPRDVDCVQGLIPPHGGLREPVDRMVPPEQIPEVLATAESLPKVPVSDADLSTVYRSWGWCAKPIRRSDGPRHLCNACWRKAVIERNGRLYAWTIPLALSRDGGKGTRTGSRGRMCTYQLIRSGQSQC